MQGRLFFQKGGPGHGDGFLREDIGNIPGAVAEEDAALAQFCYFLEQVGVLAFFRSQGNDADGGACPGHFAQRGFIIVRFFGVVGIGKKDQVPGSRLCFLQFRPSGPEPFPHEDAAAHGLDAGDAAEHLVPVGAYPAHVHNGVGRAVHGEDGDKIFISKVQDGLAGAGIRQVHLGFASGS